MIDGQQVKRIKCPHCGWTRKVDLGAIEAEGTAGVSSGMEEPLLDAAERVRALLADSGLDEADAWVGMPECSSCGNAYQYNVRTEEVRAVPATSGAPQQVSAAPRQSETRDQAPEEPERARERIEESLAMQEERGNRPAMMVNLHQLGMLHQARGEHGRARERYEQSLALAEELDDGTGVARGLHQLGTLLEAEGAHAEAVRAVSRALLIFMQLDSPDRDIASRTLARLRKKMGDGAFEAALKAAGADATGREDAVAEWEMARDRMFQMVGRNTVAVLTSAPEKKDEWWETLGKLQAQARAQQQDDFVQFVGLLRQLIEGADAAALTSSVPPSLGPAWDAVLRGISLAAKE